MAKSNLVIVESPAKAKTIGKYLGPGYQVKASMGHVRDLPKSKLGVDVEHGFTLDYQPIKGKEEVIDDLQKTAKKSEKVFLATDPDREGEAISWHLKELLGIPDDKTYRVTFNEITKKVVNEAIAAPRAIDQNLVDAQQARRVLDRIVGYQISPLLWKKIRRGLSAGRVQSVATRLVAEREAEIKAFVPEEYWSLDVDLERIAPNLGQFRAAFYGREKKMDLHSEEEVQAVVSAVQADSFTVQGVKRQDKQRNPAPPFTTSTLQQEASRKLNMTPRRTMSIAQQLYEGVDIEGEGTIGLITYMRTDSLRLSDEATEAAKNFIQGRYGADYYPGKPRVFKTKSGAQDAHEAIRPSNVNLTPEQLKKDLTSEQYRLYKLIWSRFLACQMAPAVYDSVTIEVESAGYRFRANHSALKFSGYTAVYVEGKDEDEEVLRQSPLPDLREGEALELLKSEPGQHFTQPPSRYTEATLIKALEEKGIGRPSTYAPTISTILDREYVVKEGKNLRTTPLGEVVNDLMKEKFPDIVDTAFTARMEELLDEVEEGKENWKDILSGFYGDFERELQAAEQDTERIKVPDEVSDVICPLCGRNLVFKSGRFGRFLACPGWPECPHTQPIVIEMPGKCPKCGGKILKKTSKRGYAYYGCENNTNKDESKRCDFMTWDVPVKETCPECGHTLFKKSGRGFKKPFCINPECPNFLPEDQRGYKKKTPENANLAEGVPPEEEKKTVKKTAAKKPAAKKTVAKKTETTKKAAAKKEPAKKTTAKKTAKKTEEA
ncbi:type I DNA topoisomerase [Pseudoflavonifractor sp. DSM 107456]|uniref:DNA topoisomerase 1 n=1 Tax=Pseudoflavonifractor gallinarum TaxID=2779352 RepID=A0ABR9R900_9FIRM|nr:type I DNA topoisomerase [Pseudoflavonifractor gallinarum]MBE5054865.1 type I DNA topoisomerase [Pseudoflavonifractor gallinarum]